MHARVLLEIDKHSGVPIFRQIVDQVRYQIMTGILAEGSQLMSVRELSAKLKVNPMTISKAYSLLELEQFVDRKRGIGLFITKPQAELNKRAKLKIVAEFLEKAALHAVQLTISEDEARTLFSQFYKKYESQTGEVDDE